MPQDLLTDPRTEVASTLATSGLPLLARAVAAGAVGGAGLHAVLDCLASLAADGHDAAALAEAEEFLTSIAAATDPAHVGQELRVHCDEVLRPHLAAGDQDDDEDEDEARSDEARSDEARSDEARLEEPVSDGPDTAAAAIAVDASAPDGRTTAAAHDGVSVDAPTPDESGRIAAGSPDHERADEDGGPPARRDVRSRGRTSRARDRQRLRRRRSAGRADPVGADRRARRDRPSGSSADAARPRGPAHRPSGPRNRGYGRTGDGEARAGPCRRQDDELCAVGPAGHRRVEVRVRRRRRGFRGEGLRAVEVLEAAPAVGALPDDYLDGVVGDDPSFRPAVAPVTRAVGTRARRLTSPSPARRRTTREDPMATGETGFDDVTFDLVSVQYHALKAGHDYGQYVRDADNAGLSDVADFFREVMEADSQRAHRCHEFLARLSGAEPAGT